MVQTMNSLDSFLHPQAIAAAFAIVDLTVAWFVVLMAVSRLAVPAGLTNNLRERSGRQQLA